MPSLTVTGQHIKEKQRGARGTGHGAQGTVCVYIIKDSQS